METFTSTQAIHYTSWKKERDKMIETSYKFKRIFYSVET